MSPLELLSRSAGVLHRDLLYAMADAALDDGLTYLSRGFRELADRERWPERILAEAVPGERPERVAWEWWKRKDPDRVYGCALPEPVVAALIARRRMKLMWPLNFSSCGEALRAAAEAWADVLAYREGAEGKLRRLEEEVAARGGGLQRRFA